VSDPPLRRLVGQTALVTGSTRGIGRTIAEWLAHEGANIVVSGREQDAVEQSVTMRAPGVEAWGIPAGLARVSEAHWLAEATLSLVPKLNILVNNAGMSIRGHVWEVSDAEWEEQVNVNFRSPFVLAQHAARHMIARGVGGGSSIPVRSARMPSTRTPRSTTARRARSRS
jgi:NAD(P)-dependent dehydrogenase (short-subunit alcohol dehydrogenase family)